MTGKEVASAGDGVVYHAQVHVCNPTTLTRKHVMRRNRLVQSLQYLQGAVSSALGPDQSIEGM